MTGRRVWLDLTELVMHPLQTGIQRLERELIRHWPTPNQLLPCRYDVAENRFTALSTKVFDILGARGMRDGLTMSEQHQQLAPLLQGPPTMFRPGDILLNPEVFFERGRASHYEALASSGVVDIAWVVYDFVVYLRPYDYPQGAIRDCMPYIRALRSIERIVCISEKTRDDHARIIRRAVNAVVVPLGADGLGANRNSFSASRRSYACMGTIEPRKNVALLLDVFRENWRTGGDATLVLAGRLDDRAVREARMLEELAGEKRLRVLGAVTDAVMREVLGEVRATFYLSEFEGFGIPPIESLKVGVPVVVYDNTPSIAMLPAAGQLRLPQVTRDSVAASLARLEDDTEAERLWSEAADVVLPGWQQVVQTVAAWVNG